MFPGLMCWDIVSRYYIWKPEPVLVIRVFSKLHTGGPLVTVLSNNPKKKIINKFLG